MVEQQEQQPTVCQAVFRTLPLSEQAAWLWASGKLLASRWEGRQAVGLYHMGEFQCELFYDTTTYTLLHTRICEPSELPVSQHHCLG